MQKFMLLMSLVGFYGHVVCAPLPAPSVANVHTPLIPKPGGKMSLAERSMALKHARKNFQKAINVDKEKTAEYKMANAKVKDARTSVRNAEKELKATTPGSKEEVDAQSKLIKAQDRLDQANKDASAKLWHATNARVDLHQAQDTAMGLAKPVLKVMGIGAAGVVGTAALAGTLGGLAANDKL